MQLTRSRTLSRISYNSEVNTIIILQVWFSEHFKKWLESVDNQYILVRRLSSQMAAQILKRERAKEFHLKSHSKKLEATSFNNIN